MLATNISALNSTTEGMKRVVSLVVSTISSKVVSAKETYNYKELRAEMLVAKTTLLTVVELRAEMLVLK